MDITNLHHLLILLTIIIVDSQWRLKDSPNLDGDKATLIQTQVIEFNTILFLTMEEMLAYISKLYYNIDDSNFEFITFCSHIVLYIIQIFTIL